MARRKSVCTKWTLVLIVAFCSFVYSRPQEVLSQSPNVHSPITSVETNKSTENPIRYRYSNKNLNLDSHKLPVVTSHVNFMQSNNVNNKYLKSSDSTTKNSNSNVDYIDIIEPTTKNTRKRRLISAVYTNNPRLNIKKKNKGTHKVESQNNKGLELNSQGGKKSPIRRVITKWTDNAKLDDLDFTYEMTTSEENNGNIKNSHEQSTEVAEKVFHLQDVTKLYNIIYKKNKPKPPHNDVHIYSDNIYVTDKYFPTTTMHPYPFASISATSSTSQNNGVHIYSDNIYVTDRYYQTTTMSPYQFASPTYSNNVRPSYVFTTPTPTPVITNLGNPTPWHTPINNVHSYHIKTTTQKPFSVKKPIKHQNPNHNYPNYGDNDFEVSTFQPTNAYTDRIIIRPEEYSASPDECPTIFLTLNNTFQGQAKEACPDLNIAVNTNVINKNVVIESEEEEEEGDGLFPAGFDIPFEDESGDEEGHSVYDSEENQEQTESASIEEQSLTNYNSDLAEQSELSEPIGSASNQAAAIHKPAKPSYDDDDIFSPFYSILHFFRPAINAFNWLATVNPFTFGLFSILLSPVMFIFAGTSGVAALFAPWAFSGREANKVEHVYHPHWYWDNELKTWSLHTFENDRIWSNRYPWNSREDENAESSIKPTLFFKLKELMKSTIRILNDRSRNKKTNPNYRKNKRKKRETWTIRIK